MQIAVRLAQNPDQKVHLLIDKKINSSKFNVYHARSFSQSIDFAVKVFPQGNDACFLREQALGAQLKHPNIINQMSIIDHNLKSNIILTEFASNGSLADLVQQQGVLSEKDMKTYFLQLVDALNYMHSKGVAHMDLKLDNLLIDKKFNLKLTDFDMSQSTAERTQKGAGTPCHRAPEVISLQARDFIAADIYSLGICLYIMKTGNLPFVEEENRRNVTLKDFDLFMKDKTAFWRMKSAQNPKVVFDEDFKALFNGMCHEDPKKRLSLKAIQASKFFQTEKSQSNQPRQPGFFASLLQRL